MASRGPVKSIGSQLPENERKLASHDIDRVLMTGRPAFLREPVFQYFNELRRTMGIGTVAADCLIRPRRRRSRPPKISDLLTWHPNCPVTSETASLMPARPITVGSPGDAAKEIKR
jgi:hypothetical protein